MAVPLPAGVRAVWDVSKAVHETTPTRERVCLNGLWRWQPAGAEAEQVPTGEWGWFKVPGCWPGISDYMQKDCQTVWAHPAWKERKMGGITAAWYQREIKVPANWNGRQVMAQVDGLNSYAAVFVDGKKTGEMRFPAGEVDVTAACAPGSTHVLSLLVVAMPMKGVRLSYTDSAHAREVQGSVPRRGLCGDVWLVGRPTGARLGAVTVDTSMRRKEITFGAAVEQLPADGRYTLRARIVAGGRAAQDFTSPVFQASDVKEGRVSFTVKWMPEKLWDVHTPGNVQDAELSLVDTTGKALDTQWPARFGFREFWIEGRDFILNGTRMQLSAVPLDNAQISADLATYASARETMERLKGIGINFVYTHHYDTEPGAHLSLAEILRAADDVGMLVSVTQPHFSNYDWKMPEADAKNGYAAHAAYYAQVAASHPSVVAYAMSHNATGYEEDMNPDQIDGVHAPRDNWSSNNVKLALRAEAIVRGLDPGRIVYHHASGNLGTMHAINFYPNFVPIQELSDWFEHWATEGVKPVFLCEYGAPFTWDWTMYRGWYKGQREFGSANVPWEFCLAEWNALFLGEAAYNISDAEKANLRWEAKQMQTGKGWHRWDYPNQVGSERFTERYEIFARYLTDNWRAFRTWGVSAISPWEYGHYWKLRDGVKRERGELPVDWEHLQRPGFSPDYRDQQMERMDVAFERADWIATPAATALLRNNAPVLAYIAGKEGAFTSKDHNFQPGQVVEKQLIVINNSREAVKGDGEYSLARGQKQIVTYAWSYSVKPGQQVRQGIQIPLPPKLAPGRYELKAAFYFEGGGEAQTDNFWIDVLPPPEKFPWDITLYDPKGETKACLDRLHIPTTPWEKQIDRGGPGLLIIGKGALTATNAMPDLSKIRDRGNVVIFEQSTEVLERRFGFRVAEYGLRQMFPHGSGPGISSPVTGLTQEDLRDWRGAATLLPPRLSYDMVPMHGPTVLWCGIPVAHLWRCGNRGNVASVAIEKPTNGDFLSFIDGGYGLHYSGLLGYRDESSLVLFCQMDVSGRTESDPAADLLTRQLLEYAMTWHPLPSRQAWYLGEPAGLAHLQATGATVSEYQTGKPGPDDVLIAGPGASQHLHGQATLLAEWIKAGGQVLAVGLDQAEADALLPFKVTMKRGEYIAASFGEDPLPPILRGIGPAEVYNRDPRAIPLVTGGAKVFGGGVLAVSESEKVVFCQLVPWQFDAAKPVNLKRTHRQVSILLSRLLANLGVPSTGPVLERLAKPVQAGESRWLTGFYLDQPEEWDDPYRHFRW